MVWELCITTAWNGKQRRWKWQDTERKRKGTRRGEAGQSKKRLTEYKRTQEDRLAPLVHLVGRQNRRFQGPPRGGQVYVGPRLEYPENAKDAIFVSHMIFVTLHAPYLLSTFQFTRTNGDQPTIGVDCRAMAHKPGAIPWSNLQRWEQKMSTKRAS